MEGIVLEEFGGPDVLHLAEVDAPRPGPGQVRVAVRAAGVNPLDHKIRSGRMEAAFPTPLPATPGAELAGVVDEVGEGVTAFAPGDEVLGWSATVPTRPGRSPRRSRWPASRRGCPGRRPPRCRWRPTPPPGSWTSWR
ncbi:hypothetical protein SMICM17S_09737 [Streptomyces microflavus]